jgi:hypothetical protein
MVAIDAPTLGRIANHLHRFARIRSFAVVDSPIQTHIAKKILVKWISARRVRSAREIV